MPYCSKCGTLSGDDASFCVMCGTAMSAARPSAADFGQKVQKGAEDFAKRMQEEGERISQTTRREVESRYDRPPPEAYRDEALLRAISAGVVLLLLAVTVLRHPDILALVGDYFRSMGEAGAVFRPPILLLQAGAFFLAAVGLWTLVMAAMRIVLQKSPRRALSEVVGSLFSFVVAFVLSGYAAGRYGGVAAIAFIIVGLGAIIIANGLIGAAFPPHRTSS